MNIIDLVEGEAHELSPKEFSEEAAISMFQEYGDKFDIEFPSPVNHNQYKLRSKGFVGFVPINQDFSIRISPKIPVENVLKLLDYVYNIDALS